MKAKVVNRFVDKNTRHLHEAGDVIEVTEARFAEISAAGRYVERLADDVQEDKPLDKMTVAELKEYATAHDIALDDAKTKKAEILEAIKAAEAAEAAEAAADAAEDENAE